MLIYVNIIFLKEARNRVNNLIWGGGWFMYLYIGNHGDDPDL